jgi:hypothetical protein
MMLVVGISIFATDVFGQGLLPSPSTKQIESPPYEFQARFFVDAVSKDGYIVVDAILGNGQYLYSLSQPEGLATKVEFSLGSDFEINGPLRPSTPPKITENDPVFGNRTEKYFEQIAFVLPIRQISETNPEKCRIDVRINGQVCSETGTCQLIRNKVISAKFSPSNQALSEILGEVPATIR